MVPQAQSGNGLVECPDCGGDGQVYEDCTMVNCPTCHGSGAVTKKHYEQFNLDTVDVFEAQRRYIRSLAD